MKYTSKIDMKQWNRFSGNKMKKKKKTLERNVEQIGNQRQCKTKKTYC